MSGILGLLIVSGDLCFGKNKMLRYFNFPFNSISTVEKDIHPFKLFVISFKICQFPRHHVRVQVSRDSIEINRKTAIN